MSTPLSPWRFMTASLLGALALGAGKASAAALTWDTNAAAGIQDGGGTWDNATTALWTSDGGASNTTWNSGTPDSATFTGTAGGTITVAGGGVTQGGMAFNGTQNYTVSGGAIGGAGALTQSGTGKLTLSGANTYAGGSVISAGTVQLNAATAAGTGTITLNDAGTGSNNTTLNLNIGGGTIANNITVANQGTGTTTINLVGGQNSATTMGVITLNKATIITANNIGTDYIGASFAGGSTLITGAVGTLTFIETGSGAIAVGHRVNNTYVGTTVIAQGTIGAYKNGAFGGSGNALTMQGTATLQIDNNGGAVPGNLLVGDLTGASGNTISTSANAGAGARSLTVTQVGNTTFAGVMTQGAVAQSLSLNKLGAGSLTLSGTNTYTGATTINAGTLSVATIGNGGVSGNLGAATNAASNLVLGGGTLQYTGATASTDRAFTLTNATTSSIEVTTGANSLTISGSSAATSGALTKVGAGTLILSGTNAYTGATTVNAGSLRAGAAAGGQAFGNLSAVTTANTAGATLDLNGFNQTIGSLAGGGASGGNVTLGSATLTTGGNNTGTSYAGVISGTGGLTKTGSGTQTLTGTDIYTGTTTVNAGVLLVNGTHNAGAGNYAVSGGTLGGSGNINTTGTISVAFAAQITGGDLGAIGHLQVQAASLSLAGTYLADINYTGQTGNQADASRADLISVTGNVDFTGAKLNLSGTNIAPSQGSHYSVKLFEWTGTATGATSDWNAANITGLQTGQSVVRWGNAYYLVPEPSSFALLGLGSLLLLRRPSRRRRRRQA